MSEGKGLAEDTMQRSLYLKERQDGRWQNRAEETGYTSWGGFVKDMTELGIKVDRGLDVTLQPDETNQELREQRDDLKAENDHLRDRISKLEDMLYRSDPAEIERFVEQNPGTDFDAIKEHLRATVPERAESHLTVMEGDQLRLNPNGLYFPRDDAEDAEDTVQEV